MREAPLLQLQDDRWDWLDWPIWFRELGVTPPRARPVLTANSYTLLVNAACDGQGIAIGWRHLIDRHLERAWLVRAADIKLETGRHFYAMAREGGPLSAENSRIMAWVEKEFRDSLIAP